MRKAREWVGLFFRGNLGKISIISVGNKRRFMQSNAKSSAVAGVLGVFLGAFGGHDWYLGNTKKAITHVCLCVGGLIFLIVGVILTNLSRDIPVFNMLFICLIIAAYVILVGNGIWGFIEGVIILMQGDAGLAAKGYQVAVPQPMGGTNMIQQGANVGTPGTSVENLAENSTTNVNAATAVGVSGAQVAPAVSTAPIVTQTSAPAAATPVAPVSTEQKPVEVATVKPAETVSANAEKPAEFTMPSAEKSAEVKVEGEVDTPKAPEVNAAGPVSTALSVSDGVAPVMAPTQSEGEKKPPVTPGEPNVPTTPIVA